MNTQDDKRESLLGKIRALLDKTQGNGCTEAEEMAALAKARALMDAYEVTDADLALTREEGAILRREPDGAKDPHRIKAYLAGAIAKFCDCEAWISNGGLTFCGLPADARFATWLLDHLANFVKAEMAKHLMSPDARLAWGADRRLVMKSFAMGACARVSQRLNELCRQSTAARTANANALVVIKGQAVARKLAELGIHLRKGRASRSHIDGSAYAAGKAAGDRASFGRPVTGSNATLRLK